MQPEQNDIDQHTKSQFWLFQFLGWLPYFLFQLILLGNDNWLGAENITFAISSTLIAILGSLLLRSLYKNITEKNLSSGKWLLMMLAACLLVAAGVDIIHQGFLFSIGNLFTIFTGIHEHVPLFAKTFLLFFIYIMWSGFYLILTRQEKLNHAYLNQKSTELMLKEAKLTKLLEQLNPHFMFNTINNIRALILRDSDLARDMLSHFSDLMRYQLNANDTPFVSIRDELDFVRDYIELVRLQLGERLIYSEDIDEKLLIKKIPRMSLQLLVENALKHELNKSTTPGRLIISIQRQKSKWFLKISNDGQLKDSKTDTGVGLKNLRRRLELSTEINGKFTLIQNNDLVEASILFSDDWKNSDD